MNSDNELLRRYVEQGANDAFAELVGRHINLVYSFALRQLNGDAHLAADATQLVFVDLARKSRTLANHRVLAGWLFTSTRYAAAKLVRTEQRRRAREQEACHMQELETTEAGQLDWTRVRPVLDDAIGKLNVRDREVILLRFFEARDYAEIGERLKLSGNTARMRVDRALDKLRLKLERRGLISTSAALALGLAGHSVTAAPAGLAASVAVAATSSAVVASGVMGWLGFAGISQLHFGAVAAVAIGGVSVWTLQSDDRERLQNELVSLHEEAELLPVVQAENNRLLRLAVEEAELRQDDPSELERLTREREALRLSLRPVPSEAAVVNRASVPNPLDRAPTPRFQARPQYPFEMRRAGISGEVQVSLIVDVDGKVQNAYVVSSTRREFEEAALAAVRKWMFRPGEKGGRPVFTSMVVPIVFSMDGNDAPREPAVAPGPSAPRTWL